MKIRSVGRPRAAQPRLVYGPAEHGTTRAVLGRPLRSWARHSTAGRSEMGRAGPDVHP